MRFVTAIAGLALASGIPVCASAQEAADRQAELTEARAIMEIMFPPAEREQTFATLVGQVVDQFRASMPADAIADPQLRAILDRNFDSIPERLRPTIAKHLPNIIEATASAYTHEFTLAELKDIHAFAQSPSGEHYLKRSAALVGDPDVAAVNTTFFAEVQEIQSAFQQDMIGELSTYIAEHPEAVAGLVSAPENAVETP